MRVLGALLLAVALTGCGGVRPPSVARQASTEPLVDRADELARAGRYEDARAFYMEVLAPRTEWAAAADRALLGLARLYTAPDNPTRDERQATAYLDRLLTERSQSPWADSARAWRELLASVRSLREQLDETGRERDRVRKLLEQVQRDSDRLRRELRREQQETLRMRQDLERLRQMDVDLERPLGALPGPGP